MGIDFSTEAIQRNAAAADKRNTEKFVTCLSVGPELSVIKTLQMFSGLDSSEHLTRHYEQRKMELADHAADWTKSLVDRLAGLMSGPELAGLGALAIAILIDVLSSSPPEECMKAALRSVFAEEKASDVWDQIDECLKRCSIHLQGAELQRDLEVIERDLSKAVTKLKNSMVRDGHMSNQALRAWVNGAAFHIQLLIHLQRLTGRQRGPIERLLDTYGRDMELLLKKHSEMVEGMCKYENAGPYGGFQSFLIDEKRKRHLIEPCSSYESYYRAYFEFRYGKQRRDIEKHFKEVRENLQQLLTQTGTFRPN